APNAGRVSASAHMEALISYSNVAQVDATRATQSANFGTNPKDQSSGCLSFSDCSSLRRCLPRATPIGERASTVLQSEANCGLNVAPAPAGGPPRVCHHPRQP